MAVGMFITKPVTVNKLQELLTILLFVAWSKNAGASGVPSTWASATGIGWIAGVIFGAVAGANAYFAS